MHISGWAALCTVMTSHIQGFSELGMTSESAALRSLFFGQVSITANLENDKILDLQN